MSQKRDFSDDRLNEAWQKIVAKKGSPVPRGTKELPFEEMTREQLESYQNNCTRFLDYAEKMIQDPDKNNDGYWNAAALWWEMRIESIANRARRARSAPLPNWQRASTPVSRPNWDHSPFNATPLEQPDEQPKTSSPTASINVTSSPWGATKNSAIRPLFPTPGEKRKRSETTECLKDPSPTQKSRISSTSVEGPRSPDYSELTSKEDVYNQDCIESEEEAAAKAKLVAYTPPPSPSDEKFVFNENERSSQ